MHVAFLTVLGGASPERTRASRGYARSEVDRLVDAAVAVFGRKSVDETTVAEILRVADLSTRAFYRNFKSKHELVLAVIERDARTAVDRLAARLADAPEDETDPRQQLEAWIDQMIELRLSATEPDRFRPESNRAAAAVLEQPLVEILERGRRSGQFPGAEPAADARCIRALCWDLAAGLDRDSARATILRFSLPVLSQPTLAVS